MDNQKISTRASDSIQSALPDEIIVQILSYLSKEDAHNLGLASPKFRGKGDDLILPSQGLTSTTTAEILTGLHFKSLSIYSPQGENGHILSAVRKFAFVRLFSILAARLEHDVDRLTLTGLHLNVLAPRGALEWVLTRSSNLRSLSLHADQDLELGQWKHKYRLQHLEVTCADVGSTRLKIGNLKTMKSITLHFHDPDSLQSDRTYGRTAWGPSPHFLGAAEIALRSPPPHCLLKRLCIHAHPPRERPGCLQFFTPSLFPILPNIRVRHHVVTGPWQFHDMRHLIDWCCSYTTEALSVHGALLATDERLEPAHLPRHRRTRVPENWHGRLRSLELHQVRLDGLQRLFFPNLETLLISDVGAISDRALTAALTSAGDKLESLSISVRFGTPSRVSFIYRSAFVFELLRRVALRRFSSIGPFYFTKVDWKVLCARSFPHMSFVHVDQPNIKDPTFKPNQGFQPYVASDDDEPIIPAGMHSLGGGRAFVSEHEAAIEESEACHTTIQLFRRFLNEADPQGDLMVTREMIVTAREFWGDSIQTKRPFRISDLLLPNKENSITECSSERSSDTDRDTDTELLELSDMEESDPWDLYWEQGNSNAHG